MRSFALIAAVAFVAVISQVSGDSSENLQQSLGITDAELEERLALVAKIQKTESWEAMDAVQQERLRQAIVLDYPTPKSWVRFTTYDAFIDPKWEGFRWRLVHLEPALFAFSFWALPRIQREDVVNTASGKSWFKSLNKEEQRELSRLILTNKNIPEGFDSWKAAVNDPKIGDWVQNNKDKLKPSGELKDLQEILGVSEEELKDRVKLFSQIKELGIWSVLNPVQQERLRQAVLLEKTLPVAWAARFKSYKDLVLPENASFLKQLAKWGHLRDALFNTLPKLTSEKVLETAASKDWWNRYLSDEEQDQVSKLILTGKNVPEGYANWKAAVNDEKIGEWIKQNKAKILS